MTARIYRSCWVVSTPAADTLQHTRYLTFPSWFWISFLLLSLLRFSFFLFFSCSSPACLFITFPLHSSKFWNNNFSQYSKEVEHSWNHLVFFSPGRHASGDFHSPSHELWIDSKSGRDPGGKPPLLQLAWLQRGHHRSRLHHRFHAQHREHGRHGALPVQQLSAGEQHVTLLQEPEPGSLSLGVHQLLPHVWAAHWLRRDHRHRWPGVFVCVAAYICSQGINSNQGFVWTSVWLGVCLSFLSIYSLLSDRVTPTGWHHVCLPAFYILITACVCVCQLYAPACDWQILVCIWTQKHRHSKYCQPVSHFPNAHHWYQMAHYSLD